MAYIDKIESNESIEHKEAKFKLFDRLVDTRFTFINQFGKELNVTPKSTWDNLYMEAYVYKGNNTNDPYTNSPCSMCYSKTEEFISRIDSSKKDVYEKFAEADEYCFNNRFITSEFNHNLYTLDHDYWTEDDGNERICNTYSTFHAHPCSICKYKGKLDCIAIFDIAGSRKGNYTIAIEVVKTSHCSENKIKFCKDKNLFLIEVDYKDILSLKNDETVLSCVSMWWYEIINKSGRKFTCI